MAAMKEELHETEFIAIKEERIDNDTTVDVTIVPVEFEECGENISETKPLVRFAKKYFEMVYLSAKEVEDIYETERSQVDNSKFRYKCPECKVGYKNSIDVKRHKTFHHDKSPPPYKCLECEEVVPTLQDLKDHWRWKHTPMFKCKLCSQIFRTRRQIRAHLSEHDSELDTYQEVFPCTVCSVVCKYVSSLRRHMKRHQVKIKPSNKHCEACEASTESPCIHLKTGRKQANRRLLKFVCGECGHRYPDKSKLRDHVEEKHLQMTRPCPVCNKPIANRKNLRRHIQNIHEGGYRKRKIIRKSIKTSEDTSKQNLNDTDPFSLSHELCNSETNKK